MPNFLKRAVFRSSGAFVEGLSRFTKGAAFSVSFARSLLNRVTGYDTCEGLKARVLQCDSEYSAVRGKAQKSKAAYSRAIDERSQCQRDLNALLQRKHMWTPDDVSRFTGLYRDEIRLEQEEHSAKSENSQAEEQLEHAHVSLMNAMRERYQQEQVWSEKIRGISTAGTAVFYFPRIRDCWAAAG